jgi:hypothetical protein
LKKFVVEIDDDSYEVLKEACSYSRFKVDPEDIISRIVQFVLPDRDRLDFLVATLPTRKDLIYDTMFGNEWGLWHMDMAPDREWVTVEEAERLFPHIKPKPDHLKVVK